MTPELHAKLLGWLESGSPTQQRHAAIRLSMQDAWSVAAGPPAKRPTQDEIDAARAAMLTARFPPQHKVGLGGCCGG